MSIQNSLTPSLLASRDRANWTGVSLEHYLYTENNCKAIAGIKMNIFLETDRIILRNLTIEDLDNLVELDSNSEVMRFINGGIATSREAIANNFSSFSC